MISFKLSLKYIFFGLIGFFLSAFTTLLVLEVILRFFPVNEGLRAQPVNDENPIFRFEPNRKSLFSKNWNFDIKNKVKINNAGFINNNDYHTKSHLPLLSVIGDSYVEALMVPFEKSISGLLSAEYEDQRVYSFAASGAGLSQHLVWAKLANEKYNSDYFIFVIIANDFLESLSKYGQSPGFHRFDIRNKNDWNLSLTNYEPSIIRKVFRHSKLAMYLITNLKVHALFDIPLNLGKSDKRQQYVSNFDANVTKQFWDDSRMATSIYLENITRFTGTKKDKIMFIIDGIRPEIYDKKKLSLVKDSFWAKMRNYFILEAKNQGYEILDMQEYFLSDYEKENKKFEFKTDSHWNDNGHDTVYQAILKSNLWKNFLKQK